jgi:uncharacterized protein
MLDHPLIAAYYDAAGNACDTCESCAIFGVCGGGMLVHRWSTASGFDNPTVYCADRMKLIVYIQNRILEDLPARAIQRAGVRPFSIKEVRASIDTAVEEPRLIETSS